MASAGGLVQIVSSGYQDIFLNKNPQITFFKKIFKRHTIFSTEFVEILPEQDPEFNNSISFILNVGDLISKCYLEIDLPQLSFSDQYINSDYYKQNKLLKITNATTSQQQWLNTYTNLKSWFDIESQLYRILTSYLQSDNIGLSVLQDRVYQFNYSNRVSKDKYKNSIDPLVLSQINISAYISSLSTLIDANTVIVIQKQIDQMYKTATDYLAYYNTKYIYWTDIISKLEQPNQIKFNWSEYLGHNFFQYFNLELAGQEFQKYSKDALHINQTHKVAQDYVPNYNVMIGNVPELNEFNVITKGGSKIFVPLIFWFNKDYGGSLPLVALQYSTVKITCKISPLNQIVCFENYDSEYKNLLKVTIDNNISNPNTWILNQNLLYVAGNISYNLDSKSITYNTSYINWESLKQQYPNLSDNEISWLLLNYGSPFTQNQLINMLYPAQSLVYLNASNPSGITPPDNPPINPNSTNYMMPQAQYIITQNQYTKLMLDLPSFNGTALIGTNTIDKDSMASKIGSYYPYINFNVYQGLIPNPNIKLIAQTIYLDDVERGKFANSKLEYICEIFDESIYNVAIQQNFDCELGFYNPCKELYWYSQPQLYLSGITPNGQNISLEYDTIEYLSNPQIASQTFTLSQYDVIPKTPQIKSDVIDMNYFTFLQSWKYLNNILPSGVFYNSFCLYPEETQPSGTANLMEIKGKEFKIKFNNEFIKEYKSLLNTLYGSTSNLALNKSQFLIKFIAKSYDMFVVHKGNAKMAFSVGF